MEKETGPMNDAPPPVPVIVRTVPVHSERPLLPFLIPIGPHKTAHIYTDARDIPPELTRNWQLGGK